LADRRDPRTRILEVPCRDLARMVLDHRHNTIRAKTINQNKIHFEYMDQAYWKVDKNILLGRQMPISLVAMRPELALTDINTFWDWGVVYEFCPSRKLTVIGDSDEFLMLELRDCETHRDLIRRGPTTPKAAASRMTGYITQYQIDAGRFPLTLHASGLPDGVAEAHASLQGFIDGLISYFPSTPADHRDHSQWRYHKEHLRRYHEEKARAAEAKQLAGELARLAAERDKERSLIWRRREQALELIERQFAEALGQLTARFDPALAALRMRLEAHQGTNNPLPADDSATEPGAVLLPIARPSSGLFSRIHKSLLGDVPRTPPWHPLHLAYRDVMLALVAVAADRPINILLVGNADSPMVRRVGEFPGEHFRVSAASLLKGGVESGMTTLPVFDFCIIELSRIDLPHVRELQETVVRRLRKDGQILMYWINFAGESGADLERDLVSSLALRGQQMSIGFVSSGTARLAVRLSQWASSRVRMWHGVLAGGALLVAAVCALLASVTKRHVQSASIPSSNCLGMIIKIRHAPEPSRPFSEPVEPNRGDVLVGALD
jgi:hypothetical protein